MNEKTTICFFGIYDPKYSRNRILIKGLRANGVEVLECNSRVHGIKKYLDLIKKHWAIRKKYDLVFVAFPGYQATILARLLTRKKIIFDSFFSIHEASVYDRKVAKPKSLKARYYWILDWLSCKLADKIILDTNANIDYFVEEFNLSKNKFIRVFVGTDPNVFYPKETDKSDNFLVHFHGNFIPLQGTEYIIEAIGLLKDQNITFQIIGRGQEYDRAREIADKFDLRNIVWIDKVPYEELFLNINKADICLGGFGDTQKAKNVSMNKIFEYMACGKPIITGDSLGVKEFLREGETAVFVERANAQAIAEAIMMLKNNPDLRIKLGNNAREDFVNKLTPQILVKKMLNDLNIGTNKKILITGGSGALGSNIRKLIKCDAPDSRELDITDFDKCREAIKKYDPDIIIHCAAWTDVAGAETDQKGCWNVNVAGTENIVKASAGRRFIYISTHYVFDGEKGDYKEDDIPNPTNFYSLTKLIGETIVKQYPNTLIIRTGFKAGGSWPYPKAFIDQWTCADFASERAPDIVKASLMNELGGIIHISGDKKTIYDLAKKVSPGVGKMSINDVKVKLPKYINLNSSLWKKISG